MPELFGRLGDALATGKRRLLMNESRKAEPDFDVIAKAERFLNSVLGYQAAIAVHQLRDDLGLDVEELTLTVAPTSQEAVGVYRVICTIVRANVPEPIVLEVLVDPETAVLSAERVGDRSVPLLVKPALQAVPRKK